MKIADLNERVTLPNLIADLFGAETVRKLHPQRGGTICDPRPGCEERNPSFYVYRSKRGYWRWRRYGGDGAGGSAYDLLLNIGYSPAQARDYLCRLAGVSSGAPEPLRLERVLATEPVSQAEWDFPALTADELNRADSMTAPLRENHAAADDLRRRGLWLAPNLKVALLRRSRAPGGQLQTKAGALVIFIPGPDGQIYGVKARNLGTTAELEALGLKRYTYLISGHNAPAWCSPDYGQHHKVFIVEGELNAAAAHLALRHRGYPADVQGLAGAGGKPFMSVLSDHAIFLYADQDGPGQRCVNEMAHATARLGVNGIHVLAPNDEDFCDLLGKLGIEEFSAWLIHRLETAVTYQPDLPTGEKDGNSRGKPDALLSVIHQSQDDPLTNRALDKYQVKIRRRLRGRK